VHFGAKTGRMRNFSCLRRGVEHSGAVGGVSEY
jgi:hypothetical protein